MALPVVTSPQSMAYPTKLRCPALAIAGHDQVPDAVIDSGPVRVTVVVLGVPVWAIAVLTEKSARETAASTNSQALCRPSAWTK